jgi:hypothetical protein
MQFALIAVAVIAEKFVPPCNGTARLKLVKLKIFLKNIILLIIK